MYLLCSRKFLPGVNKLFFNSRLSSRYSSKNRFRISNELKWLQLVKSMPCVSNCLSRPPDQFLNFGYNNHLVLIFHLHTSADDLDKSKVEHSLREISDGPQFPRFIKKKVASHGGTANGNLKVVPLQPGTGNEMQAAAKPKASLWQRFIDECKHYWHGFKLLRLELKIARGTLWKYLRGYPVTRREHNQFRRSMSDIFKMVPFSVFIIVPFAEFALPAFLFLFPNMLPSTFDTADDKTNRLKKELAAKLEMSKFLHSAMADMALRSNKSSKSSQAGEDFIAFLEKVHKQDEQPTNEEIIKHAKYFETEITLNNIPRKELQALCKLLDIPPTGTDTTLRLLIDYKLADILADDMLIEKEGGINNLTTEELTVACQQRGMRAVGLTHEGLKVQLGEWIDLHVNKKVPSSLLLISRILYLKEGVPMIYRLKEVISKMPENATEEAKLRATEISLQRVNNAARYMAVKKEQEMIEYETKKDLARNVGTSLSGEKVKEHHKITQEDIDLLVTAMTAASKSVQTLKEAKGGLKELQESMDDYKSDLSALKTRLKYGMGDSLHEKDVKASDRINNRLRKLVKNMEQMVDNLDKEEKVVQKKEKVVLTFDDLYESLRHIEGMPVDRLIAIFQTLDTNKDGKIEIGSARKLINALNSENVSITPQQLALMVALFARKADQEKAKKVHENK